MVMDNNINKKNIFLKKVIWDKRLRIDCLKLFKATQIYFKNCLKYYCPQNIKFSSLYFVSARNFVAYIYI